MDPVRQPTDEECSANAEVLHGRKVGYACWYPQTGGYAGKALAVPDDDGHVDVYVWHDGQFPFDGHCQNCRDGRQPVEIHHCDGGQFIQFGEFINAIGGKV
jgi:hypothetical protein